MSSEIFSNIPYFYIIRDKNSGKKYAGCRFAKGCNPTELLKEDGYTTSSRTVNSLIEKNGIDSFEVMEIKTENEIGNVLDYETRFLQENNIVVDQNWLNLNDNSVILPFGTEKFEAMMIKKHGVRYVFQSEEFKKKQRETIEERYGSEKLASEEITKRKRQTWLKNGYEHPTHCKEVQDKREATCMQRYGGKSATHTQEVQDARRTTCLEKYGVDHAVQNQEVQDKKIRTCNEKYGGNSPQSDPIIHQKSLDTMKRKYGVEYNLLRPEVRQKMIESIRANPKIGDKNPAYGKKWMFLEGVHKTYCPSEYTSKLLDLGYQFGLRKKLKSAKFKDLKQEFNIG